MEQQKKTESVYKQCQRVQNELSKVIDNLETLDDVRDFRTCWKNMFNAVETSIEDKQLNAEGKMLDELETLRKIKELLNA